MVYFIVKIALGEASRFEYILTNFSMDERQLGTYDLSKRIQYYYSNLIIFSVLIDNVYHFFLKMTNCGIFVHKKKNIIQYGILLTSKSELI